jgi:hypothetical protein
VCAPQDGGRHQTTLQASALESRHEYAPPRPSKMGLRLREWLTTILMDWAHSLTRRETCNEAPWFIEFAGAYFAGGAK